MATACYILILARAESFFCGSVFYKHTVRLNLLRFIVITVAGEHSCTLHLSVVKVSLKHSSIEMHIGSEEDSLTCAQIP